MIILQIEERHIKDYEYHNCLRSHLLLFKYYRLLFFIHLSYLHTCSIVRYCCCNSSWAIDGHRLVLAEVNFVSQHHCWCKQIFNTAFTEAYVSAQPQEFSNGFSPHSRVAWSTWIFLEHSAMLSNAQASSKTWTWVSRISYLTADHKAITFLWSSFFFVNVLIFAIKHCKRRYLMVSLFTKIYRFCKHLHKYMV